MERCDVLVVGGGPAGSSAARALTIGGLDVVVVDRAEFPRDKVCAGWITPGVLHDLEIDPADYRSRGHTLQPIRAFRVGQLGGGEPLELRYRATVSFGIRRCEFDDYLLRRSGARLMLGRPVRCLEKLPGGWRVDGEIEAPLLIGAGGHACPVARQLCDGGSRRSGSETFGLVAAQEVELRSSADDACAITPQQLELYFCDDLKGYGWCFRKGEYLNIGLGRFDRGGLRQRVCDFMDWLEAQGRIRCADPGARRRALKGHAYLVRGQPQRPVIGDRALLVGDALGLAQPASGEGIAPAVESGLIAAQVVLAASGRSDATALETYEARLEQRFGQLHRSARGWRRQQRLAPVRHALASGLLRSPWFVRNVVLDRWFLHRSLPPFRTTTGPGPAQLPGLPTLSSTTTD